MSAAARGLAFGFATFLLLAAVGGLFGGAVAVNHPNQPTWDDAWQTGILVGTAAGLLVGSIVAGAVWDAHR